MCGIALILSGVRVFPSGDASTAYLEPSVAPVAEDACKPSSSFREDDIVAALKRRGPDRFGLRRVAFSASDGDAVIEMSFFATVLQLRGTEVASQPMVSASGNLLVFNGEIFGGIHVPADKNDAEALLSELDKCCSCCSDNPEESKDCASCRSGSKSVPEILSTIRGPWAFLYWQNRAKTLWFGRDSFGRRSLLVRWPTLSDSRFVLSSVAPALAFDGDYAYTSTSDTETDTECPSVASHPFWEELPCGIFSVSFEDMKYRSSEQAIKVRKHDWQDSSIQKLIKWERQCLVPPVREMPTLHGHAPEEVHHVQCISTNGSHTMHSAELCEQAKLELENVVHLNLGCCNFALLVLSVLQEAVRLRTTLNFLKDENNILHKGFAPVALLFSGGLDSMIIAALLDRCLDPSYTIDLLNVSFDGPRAPDRISARAGLNELQGAAPLRSWRLVEIDAALENLKQESEHVMSLLHPSKTYMDLTIGTALWLASRGDGWVDGELCNLQEGCRFKYNSTSRVLLLGSGADEQCAGYVRHRTKYRLGGWSALDEEMRLDVQRIWKRNMGRDDRIISDNGKEGRYPFLDEDVMRTLLEIPLWDVANLDEPLGKGDKKILRKVAKLLHLEKAALLPKRAIQFGSRIARETNRTHFSSIRAANLASAGSAEIRRHRK